MNDGRLRLFAACFPILFSRHAHVARPTARRVLALVVIMVMPAGHPRHVISRILLHILLHPGIGFEELLEFGMFVDETRVADYFGLCFISRARSGLLL